MISRLFHQIYVLDLSVVIIAIPVLIAVWSLAAAYFGKIIKYIAAVTAVLSAAFIIYVTVFSRSGSRARVCLIPFYSFTRALTQPEAYRSMLMNVLFFVPLGLALPFILRGGTAKRILLTVLSGLILSAAVEVMQYYLAIGYTETDDVICNTLGTLLGSLAYPLSLLFERLISRIKKKKGKDKSDE